MWRAVDDLGGANFAKDSSWTYLSNNTPRCGNVTAFSVTSTGMPSDTVLVSLTVNGTQGKKSDSYTITRQVYLANNNSNLGSSGTIAGSVGGRADFNYSGWW